MMLDITYRSKVIGSVSNGYLTNQMAAMALGVSRRQIQRLKHKDFALLQLPRIPWNRKSRELIDLVVLAKEEYPHRSNQRIAELVSDRLGESLCGQTVRRILIEEGKYTPRERAQKIFSRFEATGFGELLQLDTTEGA